MAVPTTVVELANTFDLSSVVLASLSVFGLIVTLYVVWRGTNYILYAVLGLEKNGEKDYRYWYQDSHGNWFRDRDSWRD